MIAFCLSRRSLPNRWTAFRDKRGMFLQQKTYLLRNLREKEGVEGCLGIPTTWMFFWIQVEWEGSLEIAEYVHGSSSVRKDRISLRQEKETYVMFFHEAPLLGQFCSLIVGTTCQLFPVGFQQSSPQWKWESFRVRQHSLYLPQILAAFLFPMSSLPA